MQDFTKLRVWQRAQDLSAAVYRDTEQLDDRLYPGIATQMRSVVLLIGTHIAEGTAQPTPSQFARSLSLAIGAATDLHSQLHLARRLNAIDVSRLVMLEFEVLEVRRMLLALRRRVVEREAELREKLRPKAKQS